MGRSIVLSWSCTMRCPFRWLVACAVVLPLCTAARAADAPHPAIARIMTNDRDGASSFGTGTLVGVHGDWGLVVTNWHVIRDAADEIRITFPGQSSKKAVLLQINRQWDLAALAVERPATEPIALAFQAPRAGDVLKIAGYGSGTYRVSAGRCTQYVSPGSHSPFEMVELGVSARMGDSGGPILNQNNEMVGVLFGSDGKVTTGAYCGRVGMFLNGALADFRSLPSRSTPETASPMMVAEHREPSSPTTPPNWIRTERPVAPSAEPTSPYARQANLHADDATPSLEAAYGNNGPSSVVTIPASTASAYAPPAESQASASGSYPLAQASTATRSAEPVSTVAEAPSLSPGAPTASLSARPATDLTRNPALVQGKYEVAKMFFALLGMLAFLSYSFRLLLVLAR